MTRVVFFPSGDYIWASVRYRVYSVAKYMRECGIETEIYPYVMPETKSKIRRGLTHLINFYKKTREIFGTKTDDIIFIHHGITSHGGPLLELLAKKLLNRTLIFDFDDAIFIPTKKIKVLSEPYRTDIIIKNSDVVLAGNHYLRDYALQYNRNSFLLPTSLDTMQYKPMKRSKNERIVIGWVGSPSTLRYLKLMVAPFEELSKRYDFEVRIIGANGSEESVPKFKNLKLIPWELESDWEEINKFDIGVMPLADEGLGKGKCGFKALQYMALGIPAVVSASGENNYIIQDGVNGFLCINKNDWVKNIGMLIEDKKLREKLGINGRKTVEAKYNLEKNTEKIVSLIKQL